MYGRNLELYRNGIEKINKGGHLCRILLLKVDI